MKTPREVLLHEHRHVSDRLNTMRNEVVQSLVAPTQTATSAADELTAGFLAACWQELFVRCRRWWAGLGLAWCVVLMFVALDSPEPPQRSALSVATSEPTIEALRERRQLQAELLGIASNHEHPDAEPSLGPRSDIRFEQRYA